MTRDDNWVKYYDSPDAEALSGSMTLEPAEVGGQGPMPIDREGGDSPAAHRQMNLWAISAILVAPFPFLGVVAIPLGVRALMSIKQTGEAGRGWAVAGIIIGSNWLLVGITVVLVDALVPEIIF